jgi:hypothetical protein
LLLILIITNLIIRSGKVRSDKNQEKEVVSGTPSLSAIPEEVVPEKAKQMLEVLEQATDEETVNKVNNNYNNNNNDNNIII